MARLAGAEQATVFGCFIPFFAQTLNGVQEAGFDIILDGPSLLLRVFGQDLRGARRVAKSASPSLAKWV